jgi:endo-alpha-1,4-polygalactosaminidase (GH114 family)
MNSVEIVQTIQQEGFEDVLVDNFDEFLDFVERKVSNIETLRRELRIIKNAQHTQNATQSVLQNQN